MSNPQAGGEETVDGVRRIYEGKVVNLRVATVRLPGGKSAQREIVEHGGAVAIVPMTDTGEIILVRQYRTPAKAFLLEIPAGGINEGEDILASAHRELGEEINKKAAEMLPMFSAYMAPGYSTEMIHFFLARGLSRFEGTPDEDESIEIVEVGLDEAITRIERGEIQDAKSISGLLWTERLKREGRLT